MTEDLPTIPGYTIEHLLGEGGMARVYLAIQRGFERPVALKVIASELAASEEFGKRFLREARIVGMLSHQHIVPVYDVGEHEGLFYLAMEILAEGDLRSRMDQPMDEATALGIIRQLASALGYAHNKGFIHRDVKPDNVLFRDADTAVLTDFGIARTAEDSEDITQITQVQSVIGSPKYMSPEQSLGHQLDARTDIYSLGIMLFQMLTGVPPYSGRNLTEISLQRFEQQQPLLPGHLQHLQPLMDRMAAYERDQRFSSCEQLLDALSALPAARVTSVSEPEGDADATAILAAPGAGEENEGKQQRAMAWPRRRTAVLAGAGFLVLLASVAWFTLREGRPAVAEIKASPQAEQPVSVAAPVISNDSVSDYPAEEAGSEPVEMREPQGSRTDTAEVSGVSEPAADVVAATVPEPVPRTLPTPGAAEYFAFYDAVNQDLPDAERAFIAAYPGSIFADILRAKASQDSAIMDAFTERASAGSEWAQLVLSELFETGWAGEKDRQTALRYAASAAQNGSPLGLYHHAILLLADARTDADRRSGLRILERAARQGFFLAQTVLANYLFEGQVLGRDVDESLRLFELAGEQGDRNALFNLGRIYDAGLNLDAPDTARARTYFLAAARLGHPQAQNYLREPM